MRRINVAVAALNQTPLAWDRNLDHIVSALKAARVGEIELVVLPEMSITGYGCEDAFHSPAVIEMAWKQLLEIVPHTKGLVTLVGLPLMYRHGIFNVAAVLVDGKIAGLVGKKHLCGDGIHYEPRWFKPWPAGLRASFERDGQGYPLGDIFFSINGVRVGLEICEDAWGADRPGADLALSAVDIIVNPSASHFAFGKHELRKRFVLESSRAFGVSYLYSNLLGCEAGRIIYDGGCFVASDGKMLALGKRFSYKDVELTATSIDLDVTRMRQAKLVSFLPNLERDEQCVKVEGFSFSFDKGPHSHAAQPEPSWESTAHIKCEEFSRAVSLALFDYLRKSLSQGFVVSLSGGADSSSVACLVALMVKFATAELGVEGLQEKLQHVVALSKAQVKELTCEFIVFKLLTCIYQRTRNNSDVTRHAAKTLAKELSAEFFEFELDELVDGYVDLVSNALGKELSWGKDDISLQNVQARARVPGLWLVANRFAKLLLTTSNRSEAAVGYATMDGDTSGGLNPIGGIDKAFLRKWLKWLEEKGPEGSTKIPALSFVNKQQPTAELRPLEMNQTDEADLMPYEILEAIEQLAIGEKKSPLEVFKILLETSNESISGEKVLPQQWVDWVKRFFRLWSVNQWKRERYAPSFHLDDKNLDPKTWCRFPILSGGYAKEISELEAYVQSQGYA